MGQAPEQALATILKELVAKGTITQAQADAIIAAHTAAELAVQPATEPAAQPALQLRAGDCQGGLDGCTCTKHLGASSAGGRAFAGACEIAL